MVLDGSSGHIAVVVFWVRVDRRWRCGERGPVSEPGEERGSLDQGCGAELRVSEVQIQQLTKQSSNVSLKGVLATFC